MIIAIDFNNTLAETDRLLDELITQLIPQRTGIDFDDLHYAEKNIILDHINKEEKEHGLMDYPIEGAAEAMHQLIEDGHELFILTANPATVKIPLAAWMKKHGFPEIPIKHVGPGKHHHKAFKTFDLIIDDNDIVIRTSSRYHKTIHFRGTKGYTPSLNTWQEIYEYIKSLD